MLLLLLLLLLLMMMMKMMLLLLLLLLLQVAVVVLPQIPISFECRPPPSFKRGVLLPASLHLLSHVLG